MVDENDNSYVRLGKGRKERVVKLHPYFFKLLEDSQKSVRFSWAFSIFSKRL